MYRVFNMGIGFCVIVPAQHEARAIAILGAHGKTCQRIGTVVDDADERVWVEQARLVGRAGQGFVNGGARPSPDHGAMHGARPCQDRGYARSPRAYPHDARDERAGIVERARAILCISRQRPFRHGPGIPAHDPI